MNEHQDVDCAKSSPPDAFATRIVRAASGRLAPALVTIDRSLPRFETFCAGLTEDNPPKLVLGPVAPEVLSLLGPERRPRVDFWIDTDAFSFEALEIAAAPAPWSRAVMVGVPERVHALASRSVRIDAARTPDLVFCGYGVSAGEERYSDRVINLATGGMLLETLVGLRIGARLTDIELSTGDEVFFRGSGVVRHGHDAVHTDGQKARRFGVTFDHAEERPRGAMVDRIEDAMAIAKLLQGASDLETPLYVKSGLDTTECTIQIDPKQPTIVAVRPTAERARPAAGRVAVMLDLFGAAYRFEADLVAEGDADRLAFPVSILRHRRRRDRRFNVPADPPIRVRFRHPITGQTIERDVLDLSGRGLAIRADDRHDVFLPGMPLHKIRVRTGGVDSKLGDAVVRSVSDGGLKVSIELTTKLDSAYELLLTRSVLTSQPELRLYGPDDFDDLIRLYRQSGLEPPDRQFATSTAEYREGWNRLHAGDDAPYLTIVHRERNGRLAGCVTLGRLYDNAWGSFQICAAGISAKLIPGGLQQAGGQMLMGRRGATYLLFDGRKGASALESFARGYIATEGSSADQASVEHYFLAAPNKAPAAPALVGIEIAPMRTSDAPLIEAAACRATPPLLAAALGLHRSTLTLAATAAAYKGRKILRRRDWLIAWRRGEPVAAVFVERASPGMNHFYKFNAIRVIPIDDSADPTAEVRAALLRDALASRPEGDAPIRVGLPVATDDLQPYRLAGFGAPATFSWFIFHRLALGKYLQHVERRFGSVAGQMARVQRVQRTQDAKAA